MLFNSYVYILAFLPISLAVYWLLLRLRYVTIAKLWLTAASFYFYGWWNIRYVPILVVSILFNYAVGVWLAAHAPAHTAGKDAKAQGRDDQDHQGGASRRRGGRSRTERARRLMLAFGIAANVSLLAYFKYMDFFIENVNYLFHTGWDLLGIVLPIGISFYTFTQIAYLADAYKGEVRGNSLLNYALFVVFFPQLIAGPILHHREMMPQFADQSNYKVNSRNFALGLTIFAAGLVKKVIIADTLAPIASYGFDEATTLTLVEAWITSLSYSFQLYFDFSGYTDMAIGAALLFNIKLPFNFDSPYKSLNIQVFWRRWHMTLGRFLMNYIYIPLGGNRRGHARTYLNLMVTFLIGGFWHGAGWTFIFWGFLHGAALVVHRIWKRIGMQMPKLVAWFLTFQFVNASWVFFRAKEWEDAIKVLRGMVNFESIGLGSVTWTSMALVFGAFVLAIAFRNTNEWQTSFRPRVYFAAAVAAGMMLALIRMNRISEFLYFNF